MKNLFKRIKEMLFHSEPAGIPSTSISDSEDLGYTRSVKNALTSEARLVNFRADADYQKVLEHVSIALGQQYLNHIVSEYKAEPYPVFTLLSKLSEFGNPTVHNFSGIGPVSPTILRYVKVAYELNSLFGNLSQVKIGEIGVGFGGQAAVLDKLFGVTDYVAFDLPEVLSLFEIFLTRTDSRITPRLVDGRKPESVSLDLVLSNYAFSELSRSSQDAYLENVILGSKSGYMIWNNLSSKHLDGYTLRELISLIPGSRVLKEIPRTDKANRLIVWGTTPRSPD
jgi:hypothetical protein